MSSKFFNSIKDAKIEKEVESVYKKGIEIYFKDNKIIHLYNCDGYIESKVFNNGISRKLMLLMEFKYSANLNNKLNRAKVLTQIIYYLKRFEENGEVIPNVVLVGVGK